jgi:hypothetical protein
MAEHNNLWTIGEPITSRKATRLNFIEQESEQLHMYIEELESLVQLNKHVITDLLSSKALSGSSTLDLSADTDVSSFVSGRQFEVLISQSKSLFDELRKTFREREVAQSRALIAEQIAEEAKRKEEEMKAELSEQLEELQVLIEKKDYRIKSLQDKNRSLSEEIAELRKEEGLIVLPLTDENVKFHNRLEELKGELASASKELQKNELQKEELTQLAKDLETEGKKYQALRHNPMYRPKHKPAAQGAAHSYGVDITIDNIIYDRSMAVDSVESAGSEAAERFPDKVHIESKLKPSLPKLDFTKLAKKAESKSEAKGVEQNVLKVERMKSKIEELEAICKTKTNHLKELRQRVRQQEEENTKLVDVLRDLEHQAKSDDAKHIVGKKSLQFDLQSLPQKVRRPRRAHSNVCEYLLGDEADVIASPASARLEKEPLMDEHVEKVVGNPLEMSSFYASEVAVNEQEEADSDLEHYIQGLPDFE